MEEYLKALLEQIRCKKARPAIERELRNHMEEQVSANRAEGMEEEEALRRAIEDMGDPVEAGIKLDRIHRPKTAWDVIGIMVVVAVVSIVVHVVIGMGADEIGYQPQSVYIRRAIGYTVAGFLAMLLVYRMDYSILSKHGKLCASAFLVFLTLGIFVLGTTVPGMAFFVRTGGFSSSVLYVMFLYVPLYGAVLYGYRGSGWGGLIKSILFLLYPVWLGFRIPCMSYALLLLLMLSVMLSVAVFKDWFRIPKKRFLALYWTALAALPAAWVLLSLNGVLLSEYQRMRVLAFLDDGMKQYSYVTGMLVEYLKNSRIFGASGEAVAGSLPDYYSDYILTFLSAYFGIAAAGAACLLVGVLAAKAFQIAFSQTNRLGMMMGLGSGLVLFANTLLNIFENMGLLPTTMTFLPFFSYTGTGIVVSYILTGIVLSVYRYQRILPADPITIKPKEE